MELTDKSIEKVKKSVKKCSSKILIAVKYFIAPFLVHEKSKELSET